MSGFFGGTQLHGIPVFYRMHCLEVGTIQSEVSTTLKLSPRLSFIPIQIQVYILELLCTFTFHKTAATVGLEMKPTLAATRNRSK